MFKCLIKYLAQKNDIEILNRVPMSFGYANIINFLFASQ
jgi:hypothetical protein